MPCCQSAKACAGLTINAGPARFASVHIRSYDASAFYSQRLWKRATRDVSARTYKEDHGRTPHTVSPIAPLTSRRLRTMRPSAVSAAVLAAVAYARADSNVASVCKQIAQTISPASEVFQPRKSFPLSKSHLLNGRAVSFNYFKDIGHWATSSSENASCSVEPGTAADVGKIVSMEIVQVVDLSDHATSSFKSWGARRLPLGYVPHDDMVIFKIHFKRIGQRWRP